MINAKWHRILAAASVAVAGLGGVIGLTDPAGLGISAGTWEIVGNWLSLVAGIVGVAITVARALSDMPTGEGGQVNIGSTLGVVIVVLIILIFLLTIDAIQWNGI